MSKSDSLKKSWKKRRGTLFEYILSKIVPDESGCWNWKNTQKGKYGFFQYDYEIRNAHIAIYEYCFGKIPKGKIVRHKCDNTRCVRPSHLIIGTKKDNRRDFMERHPRAMEICLAASRNGAKGVKRFWDGMSRKQRQNFTKRRSLIQKNKYPPGSPSRIAQGIKMKAWHASKKS